MEHLILVPVIFPGEKSLESRSGAVPTFHAAWFEGIPSNNLFQSRELRGFCAWIQTVSELGAYSLSKRILKKAKFNMLKSSTKQNCLFLLWTRWLLLQGPL